MSEYVSPEQNLKLMAARIQADAAARAANGIDGKTPYESARIADESYSPYWAAMAHTD